jgi:membrane protein implicated in regulation of membrane protease activity
LKQKLPFLLEITWLIIMIASLTAAIYQTYLNGFKAGLMLYVIAFLATLMYASRRYLRKTREKIQNHDK